ncbi:MAG: hypothetical protein ACE5JG_05605, partial [Planctomycetota bacterium]
RLDLVHNEERPLLPRRLRLHGKLQGREVCYDYEGTLTETGGVAALPRLWAQKKIAFLQGELRLRGFSEEVKQEVIRLGTKHSIVTPFTAGLVVEDVPLSAETEDDVVMDRADTMGEEGLGDAPFTGPWTNSAIGAGGGAGGGRLVGRRNRKARGTATVTESAVELGLRWLAEHQGADGRWDSDDPAATGLSLLAFLGAGYTDRGTKRDNPYAANVRMGLRYLASIQADDGRFASQPLKDHAIATLALCEAWAMTRNPRYKRSAQKGLHFLARARNPYLAWGKAPRDGGNDTTITIWCLLALRAGRSGGLDVDPDALEGGRMWLADRAVLRSAREAAAALLGRILLGEDPRESPAIRELAARCLRSPPAWKREDPSVDMEYWQLATLGLFQVGGSAWRRWNQAMAGAVLTGQQPKGSGSNAGSWDPVGRSRDGGRVSSTALMTLCLEVYYRYQRAFGVR